MEQNPSSQTIVATVQSLNQAGGSFVVGWGGDHRLTLNLRSDHSAWAQLAIGLQLTITTVSDPGGRPRFKVQLPGQASGEHPGKDNNVRGKATRPARAKVSSAQRSDHPERSTKKTAATQPSRATEPASEATSHGRPAKDEPDPAAPITCPPIEPVFAERGPVSELLGERYHPRTGQISMAKLVRESLVSKRHAVIEAGTGIGKSFAYLAPVIWSGARAVVSTSNKALMSQLWQKDLPALRSIAPRGFQAALLKGRSNYVCLQRLDELRTEGRFLGRAGEMDEIRRRVRASQFGDIDEVGLPPALIGRLTVTHRECEGASCPAYGRCLYEQAKVASSEADVVVTNHALLCVSALRGDNGLLPVRSVLVIDEAHELERYAINAMTQELELGSAGAIANHPICRDSIDQELRDAITETNRSLFEAIPLTRSDRFATSWDLNGEIQEGLALWSALNQLMEKLKRVTVPQDQQGKLDALLRHGAELLDTVRSLSNPEPANAIRVCSMSDDANTASAVQMAYRPLDAGQRLAGALFETWPRVITTSATLGIAGDLGWFQRRIGLAQDPAPLVGTFPSPFDYAGRVLIYTPPNLTPTYGAGEAQYAARLAMEIERLTLASRGRAFVLCTSRRRMDALYDELSERLPFRCFCQGRGHARREMVAQFEQDGHAVLFGTRSFWEGVDIPGEALSLVILDKIPFVPIDDPVYRRQEKLLVERGGDAFGELQLGAAILTLRQGAGRLVRSETDRGVIALLDSRILTKSYGQRIIRSLPEGRQVRRIEDVVAFFSEQG